MKILFLVLFLFVSTQSKACLSICNRTVSPILVTVGYSKNGDWYSEGWWKIFPGECTTVVGGNLTKTKYYYYAYSSQSDVEWKGDYYFCVDNGPFEIYGDKNCSGRGFSRKGFRETSVGDKYDYTINLNDSNSDIDRKYRGLLIGRWDSTIEVNGITIKDETVYHKNGYWNSNSTIEGIPVNASGTWYISDGYLTAKITSTNLPEWLIPDNSISTARITEMTGSKCTIYEPSIERRVTSYYRNNSRCK